MFVEFKVKPVPSVCVKVVSWSSPKLITALSLKNASLNSNAVVPKSAPPEASGTNAVSAVIVADLIFEVPLSIAPNPEVIDPESNAPVVTILELPAITPYIDPIAVLLILQQV